MHHFDWGDVPREKWTPIRKFYLAKLRRTIKDVAAITSDHLIFEAIKSLLKLQEEMRILSRQDNVRSILSILLIAECRLEELIIWLRVEGGVFPKAVREDLIREDFDLNEETPGDRRLDRANFNAERKSVVLNCLQKLEIIQSGPEGDGTNP